MNRDDYAHFRPLVEMAQNSKTGGGKSNAPTQNTPGNPNVSPDLMNQIMQKSAFAKAMGFITPGTPNYSPQHVEQIQNQRSGMRQSSHEYYDNGGNNPYQMSGAHAGGTAFSSMLGGGENSYPVQGQYDYQQQGGYSQQGSYNQQGEYGYQHQMNQQGMQRQNTAPNYQQGMNYPNSMSTVNGSHQGAHNGFSGIDMKAEYEKFRNHMTSQHNQSPPQPKVNPLVFNLFVQKLFNQFDQNKSGTIDIHEFPAMINQLFKLLNQPSPTQQDLFFLMYTFDKDGNGKIDFEEWKNMCHSLVQQSN